MKMKNSTSSTKKKKAQLLQRLEELSEELEATIEALRTVELESTSTAPEPTKKNSPSWKKKQFEIGTRVGIITEPYKGKLGKITGKRSKPTTASNGPSTYWYIALDDGAGPTEEPIWKMEKNLPILEHQHQQL